MFWTTFIDLCNKAGKSPNAVAAECGVKSSGTVTGWSKGSVPRAPILQKMANYFDVSTDYLLGDSALIYKREKEQNEHYGSLNDLYYHGVQSWINNGFFSADEKTILKAHFSGVLNRYKELVEETSGVKRTLKLYLKAIEPFNKKRSSPLTTQELSEQFLKQELGRAIDRLKRYIDVFAFHFAKTVADEELAEQIPSSVEGQESERWEVEEYRKHLLEEQAEMEHQKKLTLVTEDELEEMFMRYVQELTPDQQRMILAQMQSMTEQQKAPLPVFSQQITGETSL